MGIRTRPEGEDDEEVVNGADWRSLHDALSRIEGRVGRFETFYTTGLDKLEHLDKTHQDLIQTIKNFSDMIESKVDGYIKQASGIVPGGLIPVRAAILMVVVSLGIAKSNDIGAGILHVIHLLTGVQ